MIEEKTVNCSFEDIEFEGWNTLKINEEYTPLDCYKLMINEELLNTIVKSTNMYGEKQLKRTDLAHNSRIKEWYSTDINEIITFFGILIYMGVVVLPKIENYWMKNSTYTSSAISQVMSRNRYQLILFMVHFSSIEVIPNNKIYKVQESIDILKRNFKKQRIPGSKITIDESIIPFMGRLNLKQFLPDKRNRFGVKVFKCCEIYGYIYDFILYSGKEYKNFMNTNLSYNVVVNLTLDYLNAGRTIFTDNFYTSIPLAKFLLFHDTNLIETIKRKRKHIPKELNSKKLKKNEIVGLNI